MSSSDCIEALQRMAHGIERCRKCPLHETRTQPVPGEGNARARVVLVGEAPGEKEDLQARPFVGRTGDFLNKLLEEMGVVREHLFITSSVKCRPPENRDPRPDELEACRRAWLWKQIECIQPERIVLLGRTAIRCLLQQELPLAQVHGQQCKQNDYKFLLTYHPTAAMRFPAIERRLRADLACLIEYHSPGSESVKDEESR